MPLSLETELNSKFRIIRLLQNQLISSDCSLDIVLDIKPSTTGNFTKDRIKAMKLWIDLFLNESIVFSHDTEYDVNLLQLIDNHKMIAPEEPHDHLLTILIHSKLSAIGGDEISVLRTRLTTDTGEGFSNVVSGSAEEWLPNMQNWIGTRSYHTRPWWDRDDSSMIDIAPAADADLNVKPAMGIDLLGVISDDEDLSESSTPEIIKPVFKPRIVSTDD